MIPIFLEGGGGLLIYFVTSVTESKTDKTNKSPIFLEGGGVLTQLLLLSLKLTKLQSPIFWWGGGVFQRFVTVLLHREQPWSITIWSLHRIMRY